MILGIALKIFIDAACSKDEMDAALLSLPRMARIVSIDERDVKPFDIYADRDRQEAHIFIGVLPFAEGVGGISTRGCKRRGIAYAMCDRTIIAHEIGHVLGAKHSRGSIMAPVLNDKNPFKFSRKSKREMRACKRELRNG